MLLNPQSINIFAIQILCHFIMNSFYHGIRRVFEHAGVALAEATWRASHATILGKQIIRRMFVSMFF